jgi:quinol monooxygenase YgiN
MSVTRINEFRANEGSGDLLRDRLKELVPVIEAADGCLSCQLLQSKKDPLHLIVIEVWDNEIVHKLSLEDVPASVFQEVKKLLAAPPTGEYYEYCHA